MARLQPNPAIQSLRGQIGNLVFRYVRGQTIINEAMDYSKRPRNANQEASSRRFAQAQVYYSQVKADSAKYARYVRRAKRLNLTPRGLIIREYMKSGQG